MSYTASSPAAYDHPASSPASNNSPFALPKTSNKPTGKGSRGPYKPRANKVAAQAANGSLSPQRAGSVAPKKAATKKRKQKERSLSLGDDIDDDDLVEAGHRDDDDDYNMDGGSRAGSRSRSVMGGGEGSRAGTPSMSRRESTMDGVDGGAGLGLDEEEEEEEDDENEGLGRGGAAGQAKEVKERLDDVKEAQMLLVDRLDKSQRARFDSWKTSSFNKGHMKKYIVSTTGHSISDDLAQIVGGIGKVYVGLIIRKAREVQAANGHTGALTPFHLREAHRLYERESRYAKRPGSGPRKKPLFTR